MYKKLDLQTSNKIELIDITKQIKKVISESTINNGIVTVYTPHTTTAITINENADHDVVEDILMEVNKIIPLMMDINIVKVIRRLTLKTVFLELQKPLF